jgi:hypothetical protein
MATHTCHDCDFAGDGNCPVCHGKGKKQGKKGASAKCAACDGSGHCPTCGGSGEVEVGGESG